MLAAIAANLAADLIWAPIAWLIYRTWRRELRQHREQLAGIRRQIEQRLGIDDQPEGEG